MATISPLEWLGIAMATRAKEAGERVPKQEEYERGLVGQRVEKYGGNLGEYEDVWQRGYGPQAASAQASNKQMYDYWMGLPEMLVKAEKEGQKTGSGQGASLPIGPSQTITQSLVALKGPDVFREGTSPWFYGGPVTNPNQIGGTPDTLARRALSRAPQAQRIRTNVMPARFGR